MGFIFGIGFAIPVALFILVTGVLSDNKKNAERQAKGLPPIRRADQNNQNNHSTTIIKEVEKRPSFYEHCKAGQRPFGEDSRTRRSERERTRTDHGWW